MIREIEGSSLRIIERDKLYQFPRSGWCVIAPAEWRGGESETTEEGEKKKDQQGRKDVKMAQETSEDTIADTDTASKKTVLQKVASHKEYITKKVLKELGVEDPSGNKGLIGDKIRG